MRYFGFFLCIVGICISAGLIVVWWGQPALTVMQMFQKYLGWNIASIVCNIVGQTVMSYR